MPVVQNRRPGKLCLRFGVHLDPGRNAVPDDAWQKCAEDPITQHYLTSGEVRVVGGVSDDMQTPCVSVTPVVAEAPPVQAPPPEEPLNEPPLRAKDIIANLGDISDVDELRDMLQTEQRTTVLAALEKRIAELEE